MLKKLLVVLFASLFAASAFAQTPAPSQQPSATTEKGEKKQKKAKKAKTKKSKAKKAETK